MATQSPALLQRPAAAVAFNWTTLFRTATAIFGLTVIVSFIIPALYGCYVGYTNQGNMAVVNERLDAFTNSYWIISVYWLALLVVGFWQGRKLASSIPALAVQLAVLGAVLAMLNQFALNATLEIANGNGRGDMLMLGLEWLASVVCVGALAFIPQLRQATTKGTGLAIGFVAVFGLLLHPLVVTLAANADLESTIQIIVMWVCCVGGAYLGARTGRAANS